MAFHPPITNEQASEVVRAMSKYGNQTKAASVLGLSRGALQARLRYAEAHNIAPANATAGVDVSALRDRIFELEAAAKSYKGSQLTDDYVKNKIIGLSEEAQTKQPPSWMCELERGRSLPGVPSALWSDWHAGEVVYPDQINGMNEYNLEIMDRRIKRLVASTINLLQNHVVNPEYPGLVLNLGGDMHSGDIHEELSESNEKPTMPVLLDLYAVLVWAIKELKRVFKRLFIACVTGNHGRNTRKPRAKGRNFSNFDWLLYQFLSRHFADDPDVVFFIPDGPDALYQVCGHRYLLSHGDQFRGGDGQIGAIGPITRGNKRKLARNSAIDLDYDTMLIGHWHQYMPLPRVIVNGSLKGYDEYANSNNFEYEPPIQALWLTHPEYGIRMHLPVFLEEHAHNRSDGGSWVSAFTK